MSCMPKGTATARERELYRYYNPILMPCPNSNDTENPTPRASADVCLTAFAQLGALRLNAKRGIITVSTRDTEYILAESGQKLSLQQDDDENDKLWHGVGLIQSDVGMAPEITRLFCEPDAPSHYLVGDLTKNVKFKDKKVVTGRQQLRAMACVPLKTPLHGVVIGSYIVVDDKVRGPLEESELSFLTDMATTVMDYLEAGRVKTQQYRAERMVKAIGLFIEGKTSLREWWLELGHKYQSAQVKQKTKDGRKLEEMADKEFGVQESTDYFTRSSLRDALNSQPQSPLSSAPTSTAPSVSGRGDGRPGMPRGDTLLSSSDGTIQSPVTAHHEKRPSNPRGDTQSSDSTLVSKSWQDRNSSVTTFDTMPDHLPETEKHHHNSVSFDLPPPDIPTGQETSKELQNAILTNDVRGVFARASNLIREAIGVEGVIYFDASVGSFGGSSDKNVMDEKAPGAFHPDHNITTSEDDLARRSSDTDGAADREKIEGFTPKNGTANEKNCNILGFSTRKRSSLRGHQADEAQQRMPETILRKLLKRYPHGKVFNFDEEGSFSASESDQNPAGNLSDAQLDAGTRKPKEEHIRRRNRISREQEAAAILDVIPSARSVFWFPLWDQSRERWFAGSLVWSTCPTRTLCPVEDITYLAAFGNSTMAEISRLSAQVLSKMKTDFISSISHELRSPLHGVLASVEFLQETELDEIQADMVSNIHASGKVLLDTINHVLDFSKVNRRTKNRKRLPKKRRQRFGRRESVDDSGEEKADICILSEEVIESIYAGQSVSKKALGLAGHRRHVSIGSESHVTVIVDIHWRPNWTFEIDAGAWRRILMNLFSNAMKYTKTGFVKISLNMEEDVASMQARSRGNLVLRVKDSGKGISQEFLKHQLYKPFTQEDSLATGAGLGLSIVKAIVQDLGGRIEFQSEPGSGTEAIVKIPLIERVPQSDSLKLCAEMKQVTKGLKFNLQCFDMFPDIAETPTGILSSEAEAAMLLKGTVKGTLMNWFDMEEIPTHVGGSKTADVCFIMEAGMGGRSLDDILEEYHGNHPDVKEGEKLVAVVLTSSYHSGPKVDVHQRFRIFYLQQPYGPHKLAKIFHQAFKGHLEVEHESGIMSPYLPMSPVQENATSPTSDQKDFASISMALPSPPSSGSISQIQTPKPATPTITAPIPPDHNNPSLVLVPTPKLDANHTTPNDNKENEPATEGTTPPAPAPSSTPTIQLTLGARPPSPTSTSLRVLLVEDNEINLKLLIATMRKLKLSHATATNGLEAFNTYKSTNGQFDVVFMDISMPIMSGIESTQHIRRFEREAGLEATAIIALTGAANPRTRLEAFESGVDLFLTKPVPMKALRGMLEDLRREGRGAFAG